MEVSAKLSHARISAQKVRLVADQIRGKKILESAIANAEHNEGADIDELKVSTVFVDEGPTAKRWRPRAKGAVNHIFKRTSHITLRVADK